MQQTCDLFHEQGYPTQLHKQPGEVLEDGFFHGLGHGVGLEVHERPWVSRIGDDLVPGDVITLEPGLYRSGYGGVRLEDIVLVTEDGCENLTDFPTELAPGATVHPHACGSRTAGPTRRGICRPG